MEQPLISIIIPVYNTGSSALELINFLLKKQKYQNLDVIIIDDGSKDDSLKILNSIKNAKVRVFHQENSGASAARNTGIKKSKGDYIIFLDSDDMIESEFISELAKKIQHSNTNLVTTGKLYRRLGTNHQKILFNSPVPKKQPNESFKAYILKLMNIDGRMYSVNNKIFKSKIIKNNNLFFDTSMDFAEDTKFVLEYLNCVSGDIDFIYKPLYIYNFGTETSTVKTSSLKWSNWQKSYDHLKIWIGDHPTLEEKQGLQKIYLRWTISHALAVARSNQTFKQKTEFLNPISLFFAEIIVKFRR